MPTTWKNLIRRGSDSRRKDFEEHTRADVVDEDGTTLRDIKRSEITPETYTNVTKNVATYTNVTKN